MKIAMLLPGPINDGGWNAQACAALTDAAKAWNIDAA
jgi:hypothetical protein